MNSAAQHALRQKAAAISLSHVSKSFGGVLAVEEVSFDIAEGSFTAIIGPNGAGKTTLFNLITNLLHHRKGPSSTSESPLPASSRTFSRASD
jgi:ABC-type branched-subunit amino acid transport system ATPase component